MTRVTFSNAGIPAGARSRSRFARRLLVGASAGVLVALLPAMAFGQALPADCAPAVATDGDTIDCVVAAPATIDGISTTVNDLTINIGSLAMPTTLQGIGHGVSMIGANSLTLNVIGENSSITGSAGDGVYMSLTGGAGNLTLLSQGAIDASRDGVVALNVGTGTTSLNVAAVTAHGYWGIYGSTGGDLSITASGTVAASADPGGVNLSGDGSWGILAVGGGAGSVTISAADVSASGGDASFGTGGIVVSGSASDVSISSSGTVSGGGSGIYVAADVAGQITVNTVNAAGGYLLGIGVRNTSAGTGISVTASGTVTGGVIGILAFNLGTGSTIVNAGTVTGTRLEGIAALGQDVSVTASGAVSGGRHGILAENFGLGDLRLDVAAVTGIDLDGISAMNQSLGTDLSIRASGAVSGGRQGIYARNLGVGALSIDVASVTGAGGNGIFARNDATGSDLSIIASGTVSGSNGGVAATNFGRGALSLELADVNAMAGDGVAGFNSAAGTGLTISASGMVSGSTLGVYGNNYGSGALSIDVAAVTATAGIGVLARNSAAGSDLSVLASDQISGTSRGIYAVNSGRGALSLNVAGVTGTAEYGIRATNWAGSTDLSITASGTVNSDAAGISALQMGSGALSIDVADVSGTARDGILARNSAGTDLTINASGDVSGGLYGIVARNFGSGALSIDVAGVAGTGTTGGLYAGNASAASALTIIASGTVSGGWNALTAVNSGRGALSIDVAAVMSTSHYGILARNSAGGTDLTIGASGTVTGGDTGIYVHNFGYGALSITTQAVTGTIRDGITALNSAAGSDLTLTSNGDVSGGEYGIYVDNYGSGALTITTAAVTGTSLDGIAAYNSAAGSDLTITSYGDISGGEFGIYADNAGYGALIITTEAVTGTNRNGINAYGSANGTGLTITANGAVTGGDYGIYVDNYGAGALTITTQAVTGTSLDGIAAYNSAAGTGLTITAYGDVSGGQYGIYADNYGSGALTITTEAVTGTLDDGIAAFNGAAATDLTVIANGTVAGYYYGIIAENYGNGALTIKAGEVTGAGIDGIRARNFAAGGTGVTIRASGDVSGDDYGIYADNYGGGALSITTQAVTGTLEDGIAAYNSVLGTDLTITANGAVAGGEFGMFVTNNGIGGLTIDAAAVSGTGRDGIWAVNSAAGTGMAIAASGAVSGDDHGIYARNYGSGSLVVETAAVTGTLDDGIFAHNSTAGTGVSVTASGAVSGYVDGVDAANSGSGALIISVADATGTTMRGVTGFNSLAGTDLSITASGALSGGWVGAYARNFGSGALILDVADVSGERNHGILAISAAAGTQVSITASGAVTGARLGILAENRGSGTLSLDLASVTGNSLSGIYATNSSAGTDLSLTASGAVTGATDGMEIRQFGTGALSIMASDVYGADGNGISARNTNGTTVSITATGTVSGSYMGIVSQQSGSGAQTIEAVDVAGGFVGVLAYNLSDSSLSITTTGTVTGGAVGVAAIAYGMVTVNVVDAASALGVYYGGYGIFTRSVGGGSVTATGTVSGSRFGISAYNEGGGALSVNAVDVAAVGIYGAGVFAYGNGSGTSVTTTGLVEAGHTGIFGINYGTGDLSIAAADIVATGATGAGIYAINRGADLTITTTGNISGGASGIHALQAGSGALALTIGGDVTGGVYGIETVSEYGAAIDIAAGASVTGATIAIMTGPAGAGAASNDRITNSGTVNGAILTLAGDDIVTLAAGSSVSGAVLLGDGEDTLNYAGGGLGAARGGDGIDTLNFNSPGVRIINSGDAGADVFADFEIYHFLGGGYVLDGLHQGLMATYFDGGENILLGTLESQNVMVAFGAGLEVADGALITGNLTNAGRLGINAGGMGVFTLDGDFTQASSGLLILDVSGGAASDRIDVSGAVAIDGDLIIHQSGYLGASVTLIDGSAGVSGSFDTVTGLLDNALLVAQTVELDAANADVNLVTAFVDAGTLTSLTPNQAAVANGLTGHFAAGSSNADFTDFAYSVVSIGGADGLSAALEQLNPEILDAGVQAARNSQFLFLTGLMNGHGAPAPGPQPVQVASLDNAIPDGSAKGTAHVWGSLQMAGYDQSGGGANVDFTTDGVDIAFGTADLQAGAVRFGFAVGYAGLETDLAGPDGDHVSSEIFRYGLFGRYELNAGETGLQAHLDGSLALGRGSLETRMDVPAAGVSQAGETHFNTMAGALRLTLDGYNGTSWIVRPHLLVAADRYDQNAQTIGAGRVTAIASDSFQLDRVSYGYGASIAHQWGVGTALEISATSLRHGGDAASAFSSSFAAPGLDAVSFNTTGREIEQQYILQGRLTSQQADGYAISIQGFAQFGDLDGAGAEVRVSKRF
jgi:hypothetical protein